MDGVRSRWSVLEVRSGWQRIRRHRERTGLWAGPVCGSQLHGHGFARQPVCRRHERGPDHANACAQEVTRAQQWKEESKVRLGKLWVGIAFCGLLGAATIERVAGGEQPPGGPANVTSIDKPMGVVFDQNGNWYIAEWHRNRIIKVDKRGITSIFAGNGDSVYAGDGGTAIKASFGLPHDTVIG